MAMNIISYLFYQVISTPFIMTNENVTPIIHTAASINGTVGWFGSLTIDKSFAAYIDSALMLIFGGIPWQVGHNYSELW